MNVVAVPTVVREANGKKAVRAFRKQNLIPANLYGHELSKSLGVKHGDIKSLIYTPKFKLAELEIDGKKVKSFIKSVQFHPVTDEILHIDFLALTDGKPVKLAVPLVCDGTSVGQKEGGKLIQSVRKIKIKTTPEKMVDELHVNMNTFECSIHSFNYRGFLFTLC